MAEDCWDSLVGTVVQILKRIARGLRCIRRQNRGSLHEAIGQTVSDLLETLSFHLQQRVVAQEAVRLFQDRKSSQTGLSALLVAQLALHAGCSSIVSFDRGAVRGAGMTRLD